MMDQTFIITFNLCYLGRRGGRSSHRGWNLNGYGFPFVVALEVPAVAWAARTL